MELDKKGIQDLSIIVLCRINRMDVQEKERNPFS